MAISMKDSSSGDMTILEISGHLDGTGAPELEKRCLPLFDRKGAKLLLDFSALDYISSAGLRGLLVLAKKARAGEGALAICSPSPMVREVMEISGFDKLLRLADSREAAAQAMS